jgi:CDGSH-type Zn-finger protein
MFWIQLSMSVINDGIYNILIYRTGKRMSHVDHSAEKNFNIKIIANGPYIVTGGVSLSEQIIAVDSEGNCHGWLQGQKYPVSGTYSLCRCGQSGNKPFCDGSPLMAGFDGTEIASRDSFSAQYKEVVGPQLTLSEVPILCSEARFCQRAGDTWHLVEKSDQPDNRRIAIE